MANLLPSALMTHISQQHKVYCIERIVAQVTRCWASAAGEEAEHKLQLLLDKSVAVVAAFSREPNLYDDQQDSSAQSSQSNTPRSQSSSSCTSSSSSSNSSSSNSSSSSSSRAWLGELALQPSIVIMMCACSSNAALLQWILMSRPCGQTTQHAARRCCSHAIRDLEFEFSTERQPAFEKVQLR
jgi:hypothetical protein